MTLKVDVPSRLIRGDVDENYGPVADVFRANFAERGEIGAACSVYRDGKKVVDLWGGYRGAETRAGPAALVARRTSMRHDSAFRR